MKHLSPALFALLIITTTVSLTKGQAYDPRRTITVSGSAEVRAVPDFVEISLAVETSSKSIDAARAENDAKVNAVLAMAQKLGIVDRNIQTDYLDAEPRYEDRRDREGDAAGRIFLGYFVKKHITLRLTDISKFEELIASAMKLGTNYVNGIQFKSSEDRKYRDEARLEAIRA